MDLIKKKKKKRKKKPLHNLKSTCLRNIKAMPPFFGCAFKGKKSIVISSFVISWYNATHKKKNGDRFWREEEGHRAKPGGGRKKNCLVRPTGRGLRKSVNWW